MLYKCTLLNMGINFNVIYHISIRRDSCSSHTRCYRLFSYQNVRENLSNKFLTDFYYISNNKLIKICTQYVLHIFKNAYSKSCVCDKLFSPCNFLIHIS